MDRNIIFLYLSTKKIPRLLVTWNFIVTC